MSNVSGSGTLTTSSQQTPSGLPGTVSPTTINQSFPNQYGNGSTADNVNLRYVAQLSLAASPQVLDLTNVTDTSGATVTFAKIRRITITNNSTTSGQNLLLGYSGVTANAWTSLVTNPGQITICPSTSANSGVFIYCAPNTAALAVASNNKLLQLDPGANTFTVSIEILGA